jgi:hypothetical protein
MFDVIPKDAYVMIIGAMKCGTTSLYNYLQNHPEICPASIKEPEFFSEHQVHKVNLEKYSDLFSFDSLTHKYALEASTGYTKYPSEPNVSKNIFEYGIKPKFIYIVRNPFDRITSHFNYMQAILPSWMLKIDDEHLIATSNYFLQLEQYRQYFPQDSILILDFDDLKNAPELILKQVYNFLGISHCYFPEEYEVANPAKDKSSFEIAARRTKIAPLFAYIPTPLKQLSRSIFQKAFPPEKRVLTNFEKEFVHNKLREDMLNLQNIYEFDVSKWGWI